MRFVIIKDGVVVNVIEGEVPGSVRSDTANIGDLWDGESFSEPIISATIDERLIELAALRYTKETSGITVNGTEILTDRESQAMISGAYCACLIDPARIINFKGANGWIQLSASEITAIASAVADHVQACFTREKELAELLHADINTDLTTGWPQ